jgi:hypothetical protein
MIVNDEVYGVWKEVVVEYEATVQAGKPLKTSVM